MYKKLKGLLCLVLAAAMMTGTASFCAEMTDLAREDIPKAQTEADGLYKLGILKGTGNGLELDREVTRAEALTLIWRTTGAVFESGCYVKPSFDDIEGHWACGTIEMFYHAGYINGTSDTTFEPDRTVTGREFVKILLTVIGYDGVTIENAYDNGIASELLLNNFTKTVVKNDYILSRSDTARLCFDALCAKTPDGKMLYKRLIEQGVYNESDFKDVLYSSSGEAKDKNALFGDKIDKLMPQDKNYMFSPLSIKMALAVAANGAAGDTRAEILEACGIDDLDGFNKLAAEMIEKYSRTDVLRLDISNSVWINESRALARFTDAYKNSIAEYYNGDVGSVNDENALEKINGWVNEKTNGKIPKIISDSDFWAFIVNAVYFKGYWQKEFYESATAPEVFTDKNGKESNIDFMHKTSYMGYYESPDKDIQIVKLGYKNALYTEDENGEIKTERNDDVDVSMYVILAPSDKDAAQLASSDMTKNTYIKLSMPKFKIEYDTKLNDILKGIGIKTAFDKEKADFSKMFASERVWLTDTVHKTYISVDEKGTEAAAVTGIEAGGTALPPEPVEVKINRPFKFVIRDNMGGEVLFMGEYAYPSGSADTVFAEK